MYHRACVLVWGDLSHQASEWTDFHGDIPSSATHGWGRIRDAWQAALALLPAGSQTLRTSRATHAGRRRPKKPKAVSDWCLRRFRSLRRFSKSYLFSAYLFEFSYYRYNIVSLLSYMLHVQFDRTIDTARARAGQQVLSRRGNFPRAAAGGRVQPSTRDERQGRRSSNSSRWTPQQRQWAPSRQLAWLCTAAARDRSHQLPRRFS
jgi:hypothetical protein